MNTISTLWIQVLTYIGSAAGGALSAFLTSIIAAYFSDIPASLEAALVTIAFSGPAYVLHHYLDGLLTQHVAAIAGLQSPAAQGTAATSSSVSVVKGTQPTFR
jgi:hypothetical protein